MGSDSDFGNRDPDEVLGRDMHVMGVLEGVIQCSPLIIVPTKGQMWNLSNHLTHLTNHSPNPSFLVRCDVFGRCILLPIASPIFVFDNQIEQEGFNRSLPRHSSP